jgi:acetyltransferase
MDADPETEEFPAALARDYPDKLFLIMSLVGGNHREESYPGMEMRRAVDHYDGIPFLQGFDTSLRAIRALVRYAEFQRERAARREEQGRESAVAEQARAIVRSGGGRPLVEREAKALLALYGIPVTREALATNADDAVAAANDIGYPVVLKIESPDISHKTEAGGVLLDVQDAAAVHEGFARVIANARAYDATARINGVLVQEMAPRGRELILGMTQDPSFGPAVAVGLGGIFVEVLKDVQLGVPPLTERDAREMLRRLRGYAILEGSGARGAGPADVDALVAIITRFAQLCLDLREEVAEIDINPLLVYEQGRGAKVVDCLIVPR